MIKRLLFIGALLCTAAPSAHAIAFVNFSTGSVSSTVVVATFSNVSAGNTIVCGMTRGSSDLPNCTDDASPPNTYTVRIATINYDGVSGDYISAWTASNITAVAGNLHVTCTGVGSHQNEIHCLQYSGAAVASFDVSTQAFNTTGGNVETSSKTITCANEAIVGIGFSANSITAKTDVGFTSRDTFNGDLSEDRVVASIGSGYAALAKNTTAVQWALMEIAIKDSTCGAAATTPSTQIEMETGSGG